MVTVVVHFRALFLFYKNYLLLTVYKNFAGKKMFLPIYLSTSWLKNITDNRDFRIWYVNYIKFSDQLPSFLPMLASALGTINVWEQWAGNLVCDLIHSKMLDSTNNCET